MFCNFFGLKLCLNVTAVIKQLRMYEKMNLVSRMTVDCDVKRPRNGLGNVDLVDAAGPGRQRVRLVVERRVFQLLGHVEVGIATSGNRRTEVVPLAMWSLLFSCLKFRPRAGF